MRYVFGDYTLDTDGRELSRTGVLVKLERKVYQMLAYLVQHRDRLVSKDELFEHIWPEVYVDDSAIARCIRAIRQAVGDRREVQGVIHTVHGQGYRFVAAMVDQEAASPAAIPPETPPAPPDANLSSEACRSAPIIMPAAVTGPVDASGPLCPACQQYNPPAARFCTACSAAMLPPSPSLPAPTREAGAKQTSERKLVTVLCGLLPPTLGIHLDLDGQHELQEALAALVGRVVQPYTGTLQHAAPDQVEVVFGAPLAQEDHAQRAVLAAQALQQQWHELPEALNLFS